MIVPKTLLQLAGADLTPAKMRDACLVLVDFQNEYLEGPIVVPDAGDAIVNALELLWAARAMGTPVFHIAHRGRPGGLFDRASPRGQIVTALAPVAGEPVVEKSLPNAFADTDLQARLAASGRGNLVLSGLMTHMCVSSTARAAIDFGWRVTIAADACATRDLPDGQGGVVSARTIHDVALVELADRFAVIAETSRILSTPPEPDRLSLPADTEGALGEALRSAFRDEFEKPLPEHMAALLEAHANKNTDGKPQR